MIEIATSVWKTVVLPLKLYPQIDWIVEDSNFSFPRSNAGYPTTRWTIQNRENDLWRRLVTIQPRLICVREFYRLLSSPLLSASTNHSLKSRVSVDFTIATDISAKRSAAQRSYYLLFTRYSEFLVRVGNFEIPTSSFQSQPSAFDNTPWYLVPGVGNDPTSVPYQDTANPSQLTRQNSLRNTRRSRDISINELLFSFSSFRRQFISYPTGPTSSRNRHLSMKTRTTPGSVSIYYCPELT